MSTEINNQEPDFAVPPVQKEIHKKKRIKKGWIIFAVVVILFVALFHFSKPYIVDYIREQTQTIGHPDGPAYPVD